MGTQERDIQDWASLGGGEGDAVESESEIGGYLASQVGSFANLINDLDLLPGDATSRPNGMFFDVNDLYRYLEDGGLIIGDGVGGYVVNPIVYIYRKPGAQDFMDTYDVYVAGTTP